ncbi:MAG: AMIN domain-containing protein [Calothrix sp. C42_A2020_038]|nr:AMIN domain-containing protein [Calothrix sp. C42_A2020_038]
MLSRSKQFFSLLPGHSQNNDYWYKRLLSISILSFFGAFTSQSIGIAAPNVQLQDWRFSPEVAQLEFSLSGASQPKIFFLSQPSRLVVDLPDTKLGYVPTQQNYSGAIQRIRLSQLNESVTRIVMDLAPGTAINPSQILLQPTSPTSWVLRPFVTSYTNNTGLITQPGVFAPQPPVSITQPGVFAPQPPVSITQPGVFAPQPPGLITQPGTTSLPPINGDTQQQPFVSVPPLTPNNSSQIPGSILPPATFPNPFGGIGNTPPLISPNYTLPTTVPTYPNNSSNTGSGVIPWGQSLPSQR